MQIKPSRVYRLVCGESGSESGKSQQGFSLCESIISYNRVVTVRLTLGPNVEVGGCPARIWSKETGFLLLSGLLLAGKRAIAVGKD